MRLGSGSADASAGVSHTASGISVRTFTVPTPQVKSASPTALERMGITVDAIDAAATGEMIRANYAKRSIEIELESMSKSTTQMRVMAQRSMFVYDTATAREIVEQTSLSIGPADRRGKVASLQAGNSCSCAVSPPGALAPSDSSLDAAH